MNKKGYSLVEIMVTVGLIGMFGFIIMDYFAIIQKNTKKDGEDFKVDYTARIMQQLLYDKDKCDKIITDTNGVLNPESLNFENLDVKAHHYKAGMEISKNLTLDQITPSFSGEVGRSTVDVELKFSKGLIKTWTKNISFQVNKNSADSKISCLSYDADLIHNGALEKFCLMAGGVSDYNCDLSTLSDDFRSRLSELFCEMLNSSSSVALSNGKCETINLDGYIFSKNLDDKKLCAGANSSECREVFDKTSCPTNTFLSGVTKEGTIVCSGIGGSCDPPTYGSCDCNSMTRIQTISCTGQPPQQTPVACLANSCVDDEDEDCNFSEKYSEFVDNEIKAKISFGAPGGSAFSGVQNNPGEVNFKSGTAVMQVNINTDINQPDQFGHRCEVGFANNAGVIIRPNDSGCPGNGFWIARISNYSQAYGNYAGSPACLPGFNNKEVRTSTLPYDNVLRGGHNGVVVDFLRPTAWCFISKYRLFAKWCPNEENPYQQDDSNLLNSNSSEFVIKVYGTQVYRRK